MNAIFSIIVVGPTVLFLASLVSCGIGAAAGGNEALIGTGVVLLVLSALLNGLKSKLEESSGGSSRGARDFFVDRNSEQTVGVTGHAPRGEGQRVTLESGTWVILDGGMDDEGDFIWLVQRV